MKKIIFSVLCLVLISITAFAQGTEEPYVVIDEDGTATFYYNNSKPEGALPIQSSKDDSNWPQSVRYSINKVKFDDSFKDYEPTSCAYWFYDFYYLNEISNMTENLKTEMVTDMRNMFDGCTYIKYLDLSTFNTQNVEYIDYMFRDCCRLETIYVGNGWSRSALKSGKETFYGCFYLFGGKGTQCIPFTNTDGSYARIDGGEDTPGYLTRKGSIKDVAIEIGTLPKSDYILGEELAFAKQALFVTFAGKEKVVLDLPAEYCDYDNTKIGKQTVFVDYQGAHTTFEINITDDKGAYSEFDKETNILTLYYCKYRDGFRHVSNGWCANNIMTKVNKVVIDPSFAQYKPNDCDGWFRNLVSLTEIEGLNYLNTSEVSDMSAMFFNCHKLTSLDLSSFDTHKVGRMDQMFGYCTNLQTIYVGSEWSTNGLGDFVKKFEIFEGCVNLKGGLGTTYDEKHINGYYAHVDGGADNPGYFTWKEAVPVSDITPAAHNTKVWSFNRTVFIESQPRTKYTIIDMNGRILKSSVTKSSRDEIQINQSGIVVLHINGTSYKLIML